MPVFTALGTLLGSTVAASAGAGIGAFGTGVAATLAAGAAGAIASQAGQAQKTAEGKQKAALQHAEGVQAAEAAKTREQIAAIETESKANKKAMEAAPGLAQEEARQEAIRRRVSRAKTLLTSPQGALGTAETSKKVLLGG